MQPIKKLPGDDGGGGGWSVYPEVWVSRHHGCRTWRAAERNRGHGKAKGGKSKVDGVQGVGDRSGQRSG